MRFKWISLSKIERKASYVLAVILLFIAVCCFNYRMNSSVIQVTNLTISQVDSISAAIQVNTEQKNEAVPRMVLTSFDPNDVTRLELQTMNMPKAAITSLIRYRQAGGVYRNSSDLAKLYNVNDELLMAMTPYLNFTEETKKPNVRSLVKEQVKFDINRADSSQFEGLPGIGPILAQRIVKYRDFLGGFAFKAQLLEVYGLRSEHYHQAGHRLSCSGYPDQFIYVNQDSVRQIARHPYVSWKMAKTWHRYRQQHGNIPTALALKKVYPISDSLVEKLIPYLKFQSDESRARAGN